MREFRLPSLGADMDEGTLLEWKVTPGDGVARGQVIAVVDTAKAAVEVETWDAGIVDELMVEPGTTVPVGTVLALLREPSESAQEAARWKAQHPRSAPAATSAHAAVPASATAPVSIAAAAPAPPPTRAARQPVSPAARVRAAALGIDPETIAGSGAGGVVTLQDVERAATGRAALPAERAAAMRRTIAAAMARAKREIPHYYLAAEIPLARALQWLATANGRRPLAERLLPAVLLLKAVAKALERYPEFNGHFRDGRFEPAAAIHVGIAIALRGGGLVAPALLDANRKPPDQLMRELADLVRRARALSLRASELNAPTVTVTNLGDQGVEAVFGVIYPPQVALIGFGAVTQRPAVVDGALQPAPAVTATLAADHRVSDGHRGALFLAQVRALLQQPEAL